MRRTTVDFDRSREVTIQLPGQVEFIDSRSVWFRRQAMSGNLTSRAAVSLNGIDLGKEGGLNVTFGKLTVGHIRQQSGADDVLDFASQIAANATAHTLTEIACILSRSALSEENKNAVLSLISLSYLFAGTEKASQLLVRTPEDFIRVATSPVSSSFDFKRDSENQNEGEQ
jgi:hypothetical protein